MNGMQRRFGREKGSQLIELALTLPVMLLLFAGTVDFGRAFSLFIVTSSAAEAGAIYGVGNPTDINGMKAAALLGSSGQSAMVATATYGSECADGTSVTPQPAAPPTCVTDVFQYVEVHTTLGYTPILPYPGLPSTITMMGSSRMRAPF